MTVEEPRSTATLRPAERADLLAIARIEERTFDRPWDLSTFESFLGAPGFLVLEDPQSEAVGEQVAGFVVGEQIHLQGTPVGHIKDLAVKPERQNAGRGKRLVSGAISLLASHGGTRIRLEVRPSNGPARSVYESLGFEVYGKRDGYYPDGEAALVMVKHVDTDGP